MHPQGWQTYDSTDVRKLNFETKILQKTSTIGMYILLVEAIGIIALLMYMGMKNDFEYTLFSDGSKSICAYDIKGKIKDVK